jgi:hypothetical protein
VGKAKTTARRRATKKRYRVRYPTNDDCNDHNCMVPRGKSRVLACVRLPPKRIPRRAILVHNRVAAIHHQQSHGWNGFRFFLMTKAAAKDRLVVPCRCGWAPQIRVHYRPWGHKAARHVRNAPPEEFEKFEKIFVVFQAKWHTV